MILRWILKSMIAHGKVTIIKHDSHNVVLVCMGLTCQEVTYPWHIISHVMESKHLIAQAPHAWPVSNQENSMACLTPFQRIEIC